MLKQFLFSRSHREAFRHVLITFRKGDATVALGCQPQCSATLAANTFFLKFIRNFWCSGLRLSPLVPSPDATKQSPAAFPRHPPRTFHHRRALSRTEIGPRRRHHGAPSWRPRGARRSPPPFPALAGSPGLPGATSPRAPPATSRAEELSLPFLTRTIQLSLKR